LATAPTWLHQAGRLLGHAPACTATWQDLGSLTCVHVAVPSRAGEFSVVQAPDLCLFLWGEVHNAPGNSQPGRRAELLAQCYRTAGLAPLMQLNGAFVIGIWDAREERLTLLTDRLGLRKLYYAQVAGALCLASEVKALLAHPQVSRTVNPSGLACLLSLGHLLGADTLYTSIRLLEGGCVLRYDARTQRVSLNRYWEPEYHTAGYGASLSACADELAARVEAAVRRRLEGTGSVGIPLSGGLDSRTLLGFTRAVRPIGAIATWTVGHRHAFDVVFGQRLASVCRTRHRFLSLETDFVARHGADFIWLTDGMVALQHSWLMALQGAVDGCDRVLGGYLGDVLVGEQPIEELAALDAGIDVAQATYERYNSGFLTEAELGRVLRPGLRERCAGLAQARYLQAIRHAKAEEVVDQTVIAEMTQRNPRCFSHFLTTVGSVAPVAAPFADTDVVEFLLSVPLRYRLHKAAYRAMVRRHLPRLARVAEVRTGLPVDAGRLRRTIQRRAKRLWERQVGWWSGWTSAPHNRRVTVHYAEWMRQDPMPAFLRGAIARGEPFLAQWCDMDEVARVIDRQLSGPLDPSGYRKVGALATLALWLEQAQRIGVDGAGQEAARPLAATAARTDSAAEGL
jgi:asparagine synthetase B (glutamine-hydrolysing)